MKELHSIQWQPDSKKRVRGARDDFDAIIPIRNELAHGGNKPRSEEDWEKLYQEVEKLLCSVLSSFQFIKNYHIVYGLEAKTEQSIFLELRGLKPSRVELKMPGTESIQPGRFYLDCDRDEGCFYELHPLFLPWPSDFLDWEKREGDEEHDRKHAAIYASYIKNKIHFAVHTAYVKDLVLADEETIERFLKLFENSLKQIQPARSVTKALHWREFQEVAWEITRLETEAIREKFSKDLYLQREHIKSAFEHFLKTDKVAFVLLGQSGVGKSNFVLSMYETYRESQDTHLIVLNSARLMGDEKLIPALTEKFTNKIALVEKNGRERKVEDILEEINNIEDVEEKKVILAFDAINENSKPQELLKRIDDLVSYNKYPWLKVMITSRPEAWQSMKRKSGLTESKYYRQSDTDDLEMELKGFDQQAGDGWLAMDRFEAVELPKVYGLYQEQYHLQTDFDALSPEMKVMLRDPLALRLVAETYGSLDGSKDGVLPTSLRTSQLYEQYINSLIDGGRLERGDVEIFLKKKLLPLMFQTGEYRNKLDSELLTETIDPTSGKPLSEEIELSDILPSTGKRVNQSFQNLADAGILIKQGTDSDYEISFKYERFYDYFGGKHLFEIAPEGKTKVQWYREHISGLSEKPFLWGPIQQALFFELDTDRKDLFVELCISHKNSLSQIERNLFINVLSKYGDFSIDKARQLIDRLLENRRYSDTALILIEAAYNLKEYSVLEKLAVHQASSVRETNARFIHYIWRQSPQQAYSILNNFANRFSTHFFPNLQLLHTCLLVSVIILNEGYGDNVTIEHIRRVWVKILDKFLLRKWEKIPAVKHIIRWGREAFIDLSSYLLWKVVFSPLLVNTASYDFEAKDYELFFERDPEEKQRIVQLIRTIGSDFSELEEAKDDFIYALERNDVIALLIIYLVLGAHGIRYDEPKTSPGTNPIIGFIESLLKIYVEKSPGHLSVFYFMMILSGMGRSYRADGIDDKFLKIYEDNLKKYYEINNCRSVNELGRGNYDTGFGYYIQLYYLKDENVKSEFLTTIITKAIKSKNKFFLTRFIQELGVVSSGRVAAPFLGTLQILVEGVKNIENDDFESSLEEQLIKTLSNIQLLYPRDVKKFLANLDSSPFADRIRNKVSISAKDEKIGKFLTGSFSWFARDAILENENQLLLRQLIWWVKQAAVSKSITSWFGLLVKMLVNLVYLPDNTSAFKTPDLLSDSKDQ
jgi:hypothetical protein